MKKYFIYLLVIVAVVALLTNITAFKSAERINQSSSNYILVEIYEIPTFKDKGIHIHYGNNKNEYIPFKEFVSPNHDANGEIIISTMNKLKDQGYLIDHTAAGLSDAGIITKIFMKK